MGLTNPLRIRDFLPLPHGRFSIKARNPTNTKIIINKICKIIGNYLSFRCSDKYSWLKMDSGLLSTARPGGDRWLHWKVPKHCDRRAPKYPRFSAGFRSIGQE